VFLSARARARTGFVENPNRNLDIGGVEYLSTSLGHALAVHLPAPLKHVALAKKVVPPKSHEAWIRITVIFINCLRTITIQPIDSKDSSKANSNDFVHKGYFGPSILNAALEYK
jgi:hypothetical protein